VEQRLRSHRQSDASASTSPVLPTPAEERGTMTNDAEAREVHATVTDSEETDSEESREPVYGDQAEPNGRLDVADEDDEDEDEDDDPDAVVIADDADDLDDLDDAEDDTYPDTVVAGAIVVEPVPADDTTTGERLPADDTATADPVPADDVTTAEPVSVDDTTAEPVSAATAAEPVPTSSVGGPKHAATDSGPTRPGMPVNGDVPKGSPMAGDPEQLHERWAAIQSTFVDDPRGSVTSASDMVTEVIATVVSTAKERESGLRGEWDRDGVDTEGLRNALRSYRALLDQLAAL
jgi:hypothetical protein